VARAGGLLRAHSEERGWPGREHPLGAGAAGAGGAAAGPGFGLGIVVGGHPVDQTAHYVLLAAPGRGSRGCVRPRVRQPGQFFPWGPGHPRASRVVCGGVSDTGVVGVPARHTAAPGLQTSNASLARLVFGPRFTYARRAVFELLHGGCAGRQLALGRAAPKHAGSCWPSTAGEPGLWAGVVWGEWGVGGEGQLRGRRLSMYFPASGPSFARSAGAGSRGRAARPSPAAVPQGRPRPAPHPAAHAQPCSACISSPASARGCLRTGGHAWVVCTLCSCGSLKLCVVNELREGHSGVVDARAPTSALARVWPEALRDAGPRYVI
jgi:hypothetical protein